MNASSHISVCVCTYKRPELLKRLLDGLRDQETGGLFTYSIVVADNDAAESARSVVASFAASSGLPVTYCVEPRQSIALARNKAVANASGDYVAFIDDDEFPIERWLLILFTTCNERGVDGVLGPVKPHYDVEPPQWVLKGRFHERDDHPTGLVIDWGKGRTGNTLLRKRIFDGCRRPFDPEFRTSEDQEFFHRMIEKGWVFIWCSEAVAYEVVPPIRWQWKFMLRRALLRGTIRPKKPGFGLREVAKSVIAVPVYLVALPFSLLVGYHKYMDLLVRLCDHLGKLLAVVGIDVVREAYVTE
jgi:succinoglycan biosynthesis protein ExoM